MNVAILNQNRDSVLAKAIKIVIGVYSCDIVILEDMPVDILAFNYIIVSDDKYKSTDYWNLYKLNEKIQIICIKQYQYNLHNILITIMDKDHKRLMNQNTLKILSMIFHDIFKNKYFIEGDINIATLLNDYEYFTGLWNYNGGLSLFNLKPDIYNIVNALKASQNQISDNNSIVYLISKLSLKIHNKVNYTED